MSQNRTLVKAVITSQLRDQTSLKSKLTRSLGLSRNYNQQDSTGTRMGGKGRTRYATIDWNGGEQLYANGHTEIQYGNETARADDETARQEDEPSTSSYSNGDIGPLALAAQQASQQLIESQNKTIALIDACEKHEKERQQYPRLLQKYNKLREQMNPKDDRIKQLLSTISFLRAESSRLEKDREKLEKDKEEFAKQTELAAKREKMREAEINHEAGKKLLEDKAKQQAEIDKQLTDLKMGHKTQIAEQEKSMEERERQMAEKLAKLEKSNERSLAEISKWKAQAEEKTLQLTAEAGKRYDLETATEAYRHKLDELSEQLRDFKGKFSLNSKPVQSFTEQFAKISEDVERISLQYFYRKLSDEETESLQKADIDKNSLLFKVPFSDSEECLRLRPAYAREVILAAVHSTIWQPFSSDKLAPGSESSKLLADIEAELKKSEDGGNSDATVFWKAATIQALESLPTSTTNRVVTVINSVLQKLSLLLEPAKLDPFKDELSRITTAAISVWIEAQSDSRDFIVSSKLNQSNSSHWKPETFGDASSSTNHCSQQAAGKATPRSEKVFTLFPIILCEKRIPVPKPQFHGPGSFPQVHQAPNIETSIIQQGVGLSEDSSAVRRGVEEKEEIKKEKAELEEEMKKERAEIEKAMKRKHAERRRQSQTGSVNNTAQSPTSPT